MIRAASAKVNAGVFMLPPFQSAQRPSQRLSVPSQLATAAPPVRFEPDVRVLEIGNPPPLAAAGKAAGIDARALGSTLAARQAAHCLPFPFRSARTLSTRTRSASEVDCSGVAIFGSVGCISWPSLPSSPYRRCALWPIHRRLFGAALPR